MKKHLIFRVPDKMHLQVSKAIKHGKAKNPSELIRIALREYLSELEV